MGLPIPVFSGLCALAGAVVAGAVAISLFIFNGRRDAGKERTRLLIEERDTRIASLSDLLAKSILYFHEANRLYELSPPNLRGKREGELTVFPTYDLIITEEFQQQEKVCRALQVELIAIAERYGEVPKSPDPDDRPLDLGEQVEYITDFCQDKAIFWQHDDDLPIDDMQFDLTDDLRKLKRYALESRKHLVRGKSTPKFSQRLVMHEGGDREPDRPPGLKFLEFESIPYRLRVALARRERERQSAERER